MLLTSFHYIFLNMPRKLKFWNINCFLRTGQWWNDWTFASEFFFCKKLLEHQGSNLAKIFFFLQNLLNCFEINSRDVKKKTKTDNEVLPESTVFKKHLNHLKQPSRGVLKKRCSENMQQIYGRTPMGVLV